MKNFIPKTIAYSACLMLPLSVNAFDLKGALSSVTGNGVQAEAKDPGMTSDHPLEIIAQHTYEAPLSNNDRNCKNTVANFELDKDLTQVFSDSGSSAIKIGLGNILHGKKAIDKDSALKEVKTAAIKLNWLPMSEEISLGEKTHKNISSSTNFIPRSDNKRIKRKYNQADALLEKVLTGVTKKHPYKFKLFLLNDNTENAAAAPGGYVYMNTGLLNSKHAELALSHEIAHVLKRHKTRETQAQLIGGIDSIQTMRKLLSSDGLNTELLAKLSKNFINANNYSKNQELQADACAVRIAGKVKGVNVKKQIATLSKTFEKPRNSDDHSNHPPYAKRQQTMEKVALLAEKGQ